ncbi:MAG: hypothetical protein ABIB71_04900 [Candidatus Woesearchaeota archaeon]
MKNINKETWRYIDNNIAVKKNLLDGIVNSRALAKKIIKELKINGSLNAVVSAIRRYEGKAEEKENLAKKYSLLKKSRLSTKTKLASILLTKTANTRKKLAELYTKIDPQSGETLRVFEVAANIKIIIDEKNLKPVESIFTTQEIVGKEKNIGELNITYSSDITTVPGVFALLSNELAANDISIIDSMICHQEHIIIVSEKDIKRAFDVIFTLLH